MREPDYAQTIVSHREILGPIPLEVRPGISPEECKMASYLSHQLQVSWISKVALDERDAFHSAHAHAEHKGSIPVQMVIVIVTPVIT